MTTDTSTPPCAEHQALEHRAIVAEIVAGRITWVLGSMASAWGRSEALPFVEKALADVHILAGPLPAPMESDYPEHLDRAALERSVVRECSDLLHAVRMAVL